MGSTALFAPDINRIFIFFPLIHFMELIPVDIQWDDFRLIAIPELSFRTILKLEESGIGQAFLNKSNIGFLMIDDLTDLANMHAILAGDDAEWKGTLDDQLLLRAIVGYVESRPKQESFCFVVADF